MKADRTMVDYEALFAVVPTPLMIVDTGLRYLAANDCYLEVLGRTRESLIGVHIFDAFPESGDRRRTVEAALHGALAGTTTSVDRIPFSIVGSDGSRREKFWTAFHVPVRDAAGNIVGVLQNTRDVSDDVATERMRAAISEEYDHRVRNILAKVSAIVRRTARSASGTDEFIRDFEPRLAAMGRAHDLLVKGGWERLGLAELVEGELAPYAARAGDQIEIQGANVPLSSRVAQAMGLAVHELATNAAKYGALGVADGRLQVAWARDPASGALDFHWTETGVTGLKPAARRGFGSAIIDRILPAEIGGTVARELTATGLACRVHIPQPD